MTKTQLEVLCEEAPLDSAEPLIDADLHKAYLHWLKLYDAGGKLPRWDMTFPLENPAVASRSMLHDLRGDESYISIIGEQCRDILRLNRTKGTVDELFPKTNADDIHERLKTCRTLAQPTYCRKTLVWHDGRDHIRYEVLMLPFADDDEGETCKWIYAPLAFEIEQTWRL